MLPLAPMFQSLSPRESTNEGRKIPSVGDKGSLFESCGAGQAGRELIKNCRAGHPAAGVTEVIDLEKRHSVSPSVAGPLQRRYLQMLGEDAGLRTKDVEALIAGRGSVLALTEAQSKAENPSALASASYLTSVTLNNSLPQAALPLHALLPMIQGAVNTERQEFPLTLEHFRNLLFSATQAPVALSPDIGQAFDGLNSMYARLALGREKSLFTSPWSNFRSLYGAGSPVGNDSGMQIELERASGSSLGRHRNFPVKDLIEALADTSLDHMKAPLGESLYLATAQVFKVMPPLSDARLYSLAAIAARAFELGVRGIECAPRNHVLSGSSGEFALEIDGDSPHVSRIAAALANREPVEYRALSFLLSELERVHRGEHPVEGHAERLYAFFERLGSRPFAFEDLSAASVLARAIVALRTPGADNPSIEIPHSNAASFDAALFEHASSFSASYVHPRDLSFLNAEAAVLVRAKTMQAQQLGFIHSRDGALAFAGMLSASEGIPFHITDEMRARTGADLRQFVRMLPESEMSRDVYSVKRFVPSSREQFTDDALAPAILREYERSRNYPAMESELAKAGIPNSAVAEWLITRRIPSLVELEGFCENMRWLRGAFENFRGSIVDALDAGSSAGVVAVVERAGDSQLPAISLSLGHQNKNESAGTGLRHVLHQRMQSGALADFRVEGESEDQTVQRFIDDAVLHVAGTAQAVVPSRKYPNSHILLSGPVSHLKGHYLSLVLAHTRDPLDPGTERIQVVTALYHTGPAALRKCLARELQGWIKASNQAKASYDETLLEEYLRRVNKLLTDSHQQPIQHSEIQAEPPRPSGIMFRSSGPKLKAAPTVKSANLSDEAPPRRMRAAGGPRFGYASLGLREESEEDAEHLLSQNGFVFNPALASALPY